MKHTAFPFLTLALAALSACSSPLPNNPPVIKDMRATTSDKTVSISASITDPDKNPLTCTVSWGDGSAPQSVDCAAVSGLTHTYSAYGSYQITLEAKDAQTSTTQSVAVVPFDQSRAPSILSFEQLALTDPFKASVGFSVDDPDAADTLTCTLDWGDGSARVNVPCARAARVTQEHTYKQGGDYAVMLLVSDGKTTTSRTLGVAVAGVNKELPQIADLVQLPADAASLTAQVRLQVKDANTTGPLSCTLNWGDTTAAETFSCENGAAMTRSHPYSTRGDYAVLLTVKNAQGLEISRTVGVKVGLPEVMNQPPTVTLSQLPTDPSSNRAQIMVNVSDPEGDALTCRVNWGDNTGNSYYACTPGTVFTLDHLYPGKGDYAVLVQVSDGKNTVSQTLGVKVGVSIVSTDPDYLVATGGSDGYIKLWNARNGRLLKSWVAFPECSASPTDAALLQAQGLNCAVNSLSFSPDGHYLAAGGDTPEIVVWDVYSGERALTIPAHKSRVYAVKYDPSGTKIASGGDDGSAKVWAALNGSLLNTLNTGGLYVKSVDFDPASRRLAVTAAEDAGSNAQVFNLTSNARQFKWSVSGFDSVLQPRFSPDGQRIADAVNLQSGYGCGRDFPSQLGIVELRDAATGAVLDTKCQPHINTFITTLNYRPDGAQLASGALFPQVKLWSAAVEPPPTITGQPFPNRVLRTLDGHGAQINEVNYSFDSAYLVSASNDNTARIWDARTGDFYNTLNTGTYTRTAVFGPLKNAGCGCGGPPLTDLR